MLILPWWRPYSVLRLWRIWAAADLPCFLRSDGRVVDGELLQLRWIRDGKRLHPLRRIRQVRHLSRSWSALKPTGGPTPEL
jgi:hypothetical protein